MALAEEHEAAHEAIAIPWSDIYPQIFNFALLVALLAWFLRHKIVEFFATRREQFTAALQKAQVAKEHAEKQQADLKERLAKLNNSADENIRNARAEAESLKRQILEEAEALSKMLRAEAQRTAQYEVLRAKAELRRDLLAESIKTARSVLAERLNEPDQRRLQNEFVDKIQVVR
jgi:F-type H+-transporting ATPase subunit b